MREPSRSAKVTLSSTPLGKGDIHDQDSAARTRRDRLENYRLEERLG